jgi:thiamine-monophosphate kinase
MSERTLIEWIRTTYPPPENAVHGDDCSVVTLPDGQRILSTIDTCIDGRHAVLAECGAHSFGRKALARAASDFAAMGIPPQWALVAGTASAEVTEDEMKDIQHGLQEAAAEAGIAIVGGDISSHEGPLHLAVTVFGITRETPVLRSGAHAGDIVGVTGPLGGSLSGKHLTFPSRIPLGIWLRETLGVTAMIDITDGLSTDAYHLADESGLRLELNEASIPIADGTISNALHDGEDYELLFTCPPDQWAHAVDAPVPLTQIGFVEEGNGVVLLREDGGREPLSDGGWEHSLGDAP